MAEEGLLSKFMEDAVGEPIQCRCMAATLLVYHLIRQFRWMVALLQEAVVADHLLKALSVVER